MRRLKPATSKTQKSSVLSEHSTESFRGLVDILQKSADSGICDDGDAEVNAPSSGEEGGYYYLERMKT